MNGSTMSAGPSEGVNLDYSRQVGAPVGWNLGSSSLAQSAPPVIQPWLDNHNRLTS